MKTVKVADVDLELFESGQGSPVLFLHGANGFDQRQPFVAPLSAQRRLIAPSHPGYGRSSLPDWMMTVDDLAYLYLDLADRLALTDATLVGACFGGWIAAEMAVRDTRRFARLVLVDALGVKHGGVTDRDIADMHAMPRETLVELAWADPAKAAVDYTQMPESELAAIVRGQQAFAQFGWKPYMHNPRLKRWLHRIDIPTLLLWGEQDRIVTPQYGEAFRAAIPGARMRVIPNAGHFPHWEQPEAFAEAVAQSAN